METPPQTVMNQEEIDRLREAGLLRKEIDTTRYRGDFDPGQLIREQREQYPDPLDPRRETTHLYRDIHVEFPRERTFHPQPAWVTQELLTCRVCGKDEWVSVRVNHIHSARHQPVSLDPETGWAQSLQATLRLCPQHTHIIDEIEGGIRESIAGIIEAHAIPKPLK